MRAAVQQRWQVAPTLGAAGSALLAVLLLVAASALYGGVALAVDGMGSRRRGSSGCTSSPGHGPVSPC